jgi:hypothetical protein
MVSGIDVRKPVVTGSFYPDSKEELISNLNEYFKKAKSIIEDKKIKALIVPHAGYLYSGQTAAWGYKQLPVNTDNPHFVLIGPSHHYLFTGIVCSSANFWQTPLGQAKHIPIKKEIDQVFIDENPHVPEHSLEVQTPFLQHIYTDFSISCFLTGDISDYEKISKYFLENYSASIFIISSDLSHYLPEPLAQTKDKRTLKAILEGETNYFLSEENTACGQGAILILMSMAKKENWESRLVYYDTSATASGDESTVVGYAAIGFYK